MRYASASLEIFLNTYTEGVVQHLITITLADMTVIRWTDNATDLTLSGHTFTAGGTGAVPLIAIGKRRETAGTEIGECEVKLLCGETAQLNGVRLPLAVINNALDGAEVLIERVFGANDIDTSLGSMWLFEGVVAEAKPSSTEVTLSLVDGREDLNVELPRTPIQPPCTAMLFDGQCSLVKASFTVTGTVSSGATTLVVPTSRTEATGSSTLRTNGWWSLGIITFTSGACNGLSRAVRAYSGTGGTFTLDEPLSVAPSNGDTFSVYSGCPKSTLACANNVAANGPQFNNLTHFRGFPVLPKSTDIESVQDVIKKKVDAWFGRTKADPERATQEQILPILYGRNKVRGVPIYLSAPYVGTSGLTFGRRAVDVIYALTEGPIDGGRRLWRADHFFLDWHSQSNSTLGLGTRPTQTTWARLVSNDPAAAVGYPGVSYLAIQGIAVDSGVPSIEMEGDGILPGTGGSEGDADPADIVQDLLPDVDYGAAFPWYVVTDAGTDGLAASSARRYVEQAGLWLSPVLDSKRPALDWLEEILDSTNCSCRWSQAALQIVPLGDQVVGTYTPDLTVQYALDENDYATGGEDDPITVERPAREAVYNVCPVEFSERAPKASETDPSYAYKPRIIEDPEPLDVARNGIRRASPVSMPMICLSGVAQQISRIKAQRAAKSRNKYTVKVGWRFCRLEVLDRIALSDSLLGISNREVRITSIEEDEDNVLTIEAEDAPIGSSHAIAHATQSSESTFTGTLTPSFMVLAEEAAMRNWTARTIPAGIYRAVIWAGNQIVAVGDDGSGSNTYCATSPDGIAWTARTIPSGLYRALAYNGSIIVAAGGSSCATSTDGITWTARSGMPANVTGVAWNGSVFAAVSTTTAAATSPDGITWTARTSAGNANAICSNGSGFVTVGQIGVAQTSPDGITWTARTLPTGTYSTYYAVAWNGSGFSAVGRGLAATSPDGITWTAGTMPAVSGTYRYVYGIVWTGYVFAAVEYTTGSSSAAIFTSRDGLAWAVNTVGMPTSDYGWRAVAWADACAVAVGVDASAMSARVAT